MTDKDDKATKNHAWNAFVRDRHPITLDAWRMDRMMSAIFETQAAVFNLSQCLSQQRLGDESYFDMNLAAIDRAKIGLGRMNELLSDFHDEALRREPEE